MSIAIASRTAATNVYRPAGYVVQQQPVVRRTGPNITDDYERKYCTELTVI